MFRVARKDFLKDSDKPKEQHKFLISCKQTIFKRQLKNSFKYQDENFQSKLCESRIANS